MIKYQNLLSITFVVLGCSAVGIPAISQAKQFDQKPNFIHGPIVATSYDGETNDLLTGGLGKTGLAGAAPGFADPLNPTAAEIRTLAIYNNYRALVPTDIGNGYGVFFGPNVLADGTVTNSEGLIAGDEYIAYAGTASGKQNVTMMVQVPASFDSHNPCIVTAPSSGSRGIYGAIGTAGAWGLKNGCAVAYTDKGTGTGAHNLMTNSVNLIEGTRADADSAGKASNFTAQMSDPQREAFNSETPDRFAFKHAHSQQNPEADWGQNVLQSIRFAFYILNEKFGSADDHETFTPANTIVIASSVSNGGGASIRAAEEDDWGLIDGIAVSEPNVNPVFDSGFLIQQGAGEPLQQHSRNLFDYTTLVNVYQSCASLAPENAAAPLNFAPSPAACASLAEKGLLTSSGLADQASEAQQIINDYGIAPEQNPVQPSHWFLNVPQAIAMTYANAYGRVSVLENLCGYSLGASAPNGAPIMLSSALEAALFSANNGIPPSAGVNLINNNSPLPNGPTENRLSISPSTGRNDQNLDGALCLRALATGVDPGTGEKLKGVARKHHLAIQHGIRQILADGELHGLPAIIVTGRSDAILPINHTSRSYFGLNQFRRGEHSNLRYFEITNAHHLDILNGIPSLGFEEKYIPLHHYFNQALDLMLDHLRNGSPLPDSQLVRTKTRSETTQPGEALAVLTEENVPAIAMTPDPADAIVFSDNLLHIPD